MADPDGVRRVGAEAGSSFSAGGLVDDDGPPRAGGRTADLLLQSPRCPCRAPRGRWPGPSLPRRKRKFANFFLLAPSARQPFDRAPRSEAGRRERGRQPVFWVPHGAGGTSSAGGDEGWGGRRRAQGRPGLAPGVERGYSRDVGGRAAPPNAETGLGPAVWDGMGGAGVAAVGAHPGARRGAGVHDFWR